MLKGVETTAEDTILLVKNIGSLMAEYKGVIRPDFGQPRTIEWVILPPIYEDRPCSS